MKFLHLGDLHIGKKVNTFNMIEEQKYVLTQIIDIIKEKNIDGILIAGDIFDRSVPSSEALEVFNDFLDKINGLKTKTYIISGNHDGADRLSFLSSFLKKSDIFISKPFNGILESFDFNENTKIYLMPYLYPAIIRNFYPNEEIKNYNDAIKLVINKTIIDKTKINILLAHQFVIGKNMPIISDSEQKSVGTIESIEYNIFEKFDYTALGHLHCPQKVGVDKIRYSGSLYKYSFSELNQKKCATIIEFNEKKLNIDFIPLKFKNDLAQYKGKLEDFLKPEFYENINKNDYMHFILTDEYAPDAKKRLALHFPNIMILEFDNTYTKNNSVDINIELAKNKTIQEHFCDFYLEQTSNKIDEIKREMVDKILCDH